MKEKPMWCNFYCKKLNLLCLIWLLLVVLPADAAAPDWHSALPQARLVGQGELRWFGLSIYTAILWSEQNPFDTQHPFALQLTYHRHISRERFVNTSIEEIKRLFGQRFTADKLREWETLMSQAFPDVDDGDQLIGIFIPYQGCRFYDKNGLRT